MQPDQLTVLVAAYNEEVALPHLHERVSAVLATMPDIDGRMLYVDDGSSDATWQVICELARKDPRVSALRLSRHFGKPRSPPDWTRCAKARR